MLDWYTDVPCDYDNLGESWVLSAVSKYPTEVANGHLRGNSLSALVEVHQGELVGRRVYNTFGSTFPLLLKFIDAADDLSIQVHPNDEQAMRDEQSLGKTEMWYVLSSESDASIVSGWTDDMTPDSVRASIADGTLSDHLHSYPVREGDVVVIDAGRVHAMCRGTLVAEIQENSDITYRLYDYDRVGNDGRKRPLSLDKALRVADLSASGAEAVLHPDSQPNAMTPLARTPFFTTNLLCFDTPMQRDYASLDSFVAYMCVSGACQLTATGATIDEQTQTLRLGELILIPACLKDVMLTPTSAECRLLEIYMELDG